jgi:hypothetical protein
MLTSILPLDPLAIYNGRIFTLQGFLANDIVGIIENDLERVSAWEQQHRNRLAEGDRRSNPGRQSGPPLTRGCGTP